jgi:putative two-component system response regulator
MTIEMHHLLENSSILVVDDTIDTLKIIGELLKKEFSIKVATNGEMALKIAQSHTPPDLILLDIMLPDINGYEVCKELKKHPETATIPVIFLTAKNEVEDEARGLGVGAVDYITKPIYPAILMARVKTHLLMKKMYDLLTNQI